jgi:hypothetical protein
MSGSTPAPRCPAAGAASGLLNVAHKLGGSLGLAILVTVFASADPGAAATCRPGAGAHAQSVHELANGVDAALSGSVVLLALGLGVVLIVMHGQRIPNLAVGRASARASAQRSAG